MAKSSRRVSAMAGCAAPRRDAAAGTRTRSGSRARGPARAARACDSDLAAGDLLRREVAERRDHPGLDQLDLTLEVRPAGLRSPPLGIAVARRPRLQDVHDEDVLALHPDSLSNSFRSWPAQADEGQPLAILLGPRGLADEQQVRVGVPGPEDGPRASGVKRTAGAGRDVAVEPTRASRRSSVEWLTGPILRASRARRRAALKSDSVRSRSWVLQRSCARVAPGDLTCAPAGRPRQHLRRVRGAAEPTLDRLRAQVDERLEPPGRRPGNGTRRLARADGNRAPGGTARGSSQ